MAKFPIACTLTRDRLAKRSRHRPAGLYPALDSYSPAEEETVTREASKAEARWVGAKK